MKTGLEIADLRGRKTVEWIWKHLPAGSKPGDSDAEELDRLLVEDGLAPERAALRLFDTGTPQRRLEGLKYLARQREEVIMSLLGDSVDDLVDQIIETGSAEIHPRRTRRVVGAAERVGLRVEVISVVRLVGRPHRRVSEERAAGEEETRKEAREEEPRDDRELAPMP
jgi:hypothetical protein